MNKRWEVVLVFACDKVTAEMHISLAEAPPNRKLIISAWSFGSSSFVIKKACAMASSFHPNGPGYLLIDIEINLTL